MSEQLRNRLFYLISDKERQLGRHITLSEIAESTGLSIQLVSRWVKNQVNQYDGEVVVKLCAYFECEVADLLYIERENVE